MKSRQVIVVGGGAAGLFAAITCAEATPDVEVLVLEKGPQFLSKVRISGGGRCNVTHACFDAREFATRYPRGEQALLAPFRQFQASDTVAWFESRGVKLKTENDGRMFPVTDSSQTIIDCLMRAAREAGVKLRNYCGVERVARNATGGFDLELSPHPGPLPFRRGEGGWVRAGGGIRRGRLQLQHQAARVVAAGEEDPTVGQWHGRWDGGDADFPIGGFPELLAIVCIHADHAFAGAIDIVTAAAEIHRHDAGVSHHPVVRVGRLPERFAGGEIECNEQRILTAGREDDFIAVD